MTATQARRRISQLQIRREQLRHDGSSTRRLEANRLKLADAEQQLNHALLAEHYARAS